MPERWTSIVLTGATGGIGRALVPHLAGPGRTLLVIGRDPERLSGAAEAARAAGAEVETARVDVADARAMAAAIAAFDARHPVDLVVANAGVTDGRRPGAAREAPGTLARLVAVNLLGAANAVEPLIEPMVARGRGRIALVGSLAGVRPLPDMPAYSASKAGLRAWGTSLRGALAGTGVGVTVITPGFITTPMSARHRGFKPFEMTAEDAASRIVRGLAAGRPLVTFPATLAALIWLGNRLPPALSDLAIRPFGARIEPEERPEGGHGQEDGHGQDERGQDERGQDGRRGTD